MSGGRHAVVTGGASGIGRATVLALAKAGYDVAMCDLDEAKLESVGAEVEACGVRARCAKVNVGDRDAMKAWADELHAESGAFDVVVNNAGVAVSGAFLNVSLDDWAWLLDVNLRGVIYGCHFFLPPMVERARGGHVVNVSSVAGLVPLRELSAYNAAKFGVLGFSESLRWEMEEHGVGVTTICPGMVTTNIVQGGRVCGYEGQKAEALREEIDAQFVKRGMAPEKVAQQIMDAIQSEGGIRLVGTDAKVMRWLARWMPSGMRRLAEWQRKVSLNRALGDRRSRGAGR